MASDIGLTIAFWTECFGAELVADETMAGTRNVFLDVGGGRLNLYEQAPNHRGPVNHLGVHVADLSATVAALGKAGWQPRPIKQDGPLSYSMVEGPDGLLIEVFHFDQQTTEPHLRPYFDLNEAPPSTDLLSQPEAPHRIQKGPDGVPNETGSGAGPLSKQALARLARPPVEPLRPPSKDDHDEVARWRGSIHEQWLAGDPSPAECGHREVHVGGVRCLRTGHQRHGPLVLYFHGGGYVLGSPEVAIPITTRLADHADVLSVDYRLAPEHAFPAAVDDGLAVYREAIQERPGASSLRETPQGPTSP